ncbi:MAG TPA: [protein-PII] uridylyltransferase [Desulfuromonadales bacterium]|nr:[protein-PII] uridylyltransferase [Desulfuromonadales bacterium]
MNPLPTAAAEQYFASELMIAGDESFGRRRNGLLETARAFLDDQRLACQKLHENGGDGAAVVGCVTGMTDALIQNLFRCLVADADFGRNPCSAVIAMGGYGRRELNPLSDVDIMFFCSDLNRDQAEAIAERTLYLLWDLGLDVGYSVRTARDCLALVFQDITIRTAMLDARLVVGDPDLYDTFQQQVFSQVIGRNTQAFLKQKYEEHQSRVAKFGSSVYMLEPNIKEGEGCLRDLHTALWMARVKYKAPDLLELVKKGVLSEHEMHEFQDSLSYLWRIRNELHYLSKRKNDQLHFDQQEKIARFLGYRDNRKAQAVEQFMQDFYARATRIEHLSTGLINRAWQPSDVPGRIFGYLSRRPVGEDYFIYQGELKAARKALFEERPAALMESFLMAKRQGVRLSAALKGQIRDHLHLVNDGFRRSRKISGMFLEILRRPGGLAEILEDMHHLEFLNRYIPEFRRIYCKVQHDAYHVYTVDTHSLFAVGEIEKLWEGEHAEDKPLLTQLANDIEKRALLMLAILFHDIGKGEGHDHSNKGADMVPKIARRLNLNREDSARLEFLVRHHLDMAHISQRRDLNDDRLIRDFAQVMGMTENLKMLYLLTYADIKAVGPDVWSEWKGFLLQELYEKAYEVMERGNFMRDVRSERVRNRKRKVVAALSEEFGQRVIKDHLRKMGMRYLLSHRSWEIAQHARVELMRGDQTLALEVKHDAEREYTELVISTLDVPSLFSMITGVLAANSVNILGAQIYTRSNGAALDVFHVNRLHAGIIDDEVKWNKVRQELAAVIEGRTPLAELVAKRTRSSGLTAKKLPRYPSRIVFDNEVSAEHTVIDIYSHDKVGLLYYISRALADLGLYIHIAKISTKADQVTDTFYVKDIFGQKIVEEDKLEEIRQRLQEALD